MAPKKSKETSPKRRVFLTLRRWGKVQFIEQLPDGSSPPSGVLTAAEARNPKFRGMMLGIKGPVTFRSLR